MLIAITTTGENLDASLDVRFGRAMNFIIYDTNTKDFKVIPNTQNLNAIQGAGIQAAQNVLSEKVNSLITGHCGPKAYKILNMSDVKIYNTDIKVVKEAIEALLNNSLKESFSADVEGHW